MDDGGGFDDCGFTFSPIFNFALIPSRGKDDKCMPKGRLSTFFDLMLVKFCFSRDAIFSSEGFWMFKVFSTFDSDWFM